MLEMRPGCECCDKDLPADKEGAFICSFECTFCQDCAENTLHYDCPNCGGKLIPRPLRPTAKLIQFPAVSKRILKAGGCK
ncbi:DUF1272 domain-containing protein [Polycladidibacter stylochi]|uniref:DUF1272 domain-containing protein n=1 Tax=Polycladidibacter stylochi TaxID=1807766 RepID=UPI000836C286|nr:DUF1272 domain-containing protein [Pseudovibrio stylochi]